MTPTEFTEALIALRDQFEDDPEVLHSSADALMCRILTELGYGEGVKIFRKMKIWYA
jgi:hypothetical protein